MDRREFMKFAATSALVPTMVAMGDADLRAQVRDRRAPRAKKRKPEMRKMPHLLLM